MAEAVLEKEVCARCGADVREGTAFCYACGNDLNDPGVPKFDALESAESDSAGDAHQTPTEVKAAKTRDKRLTRAANQRKRARVKEREAVEYTWEPVEDSRLTVFAAVMIGALVGAVVLLMVFWK